MMFHLKNMSAVKINCSGHGTCVIIGKITLGCQEKVFFLPKILCDEQEVNIGVAQEKKLLI